MSNILEPKSVLSSEPSIVRNSKLDHSLDVVVQELSPALSQQKEIVENIFLRLNNIESPISDSDLWALLKDPKMKFVRNQLLGSDAKKFLKDPENPELRLKHSQQVSSAAFEIAVGEEKKILDKLQNGEGHLKDLVSILPTSQLKEVVKLQNKVAKTDNIFYPISTLLGYVDAGLGDPEQYSNWTEKKTVDALNIRRRRELFRPFDVYTHVNQQAGLEQTIVEAVANSRDSYDVDVTGRFGKGITSLYQYLYRSRGSEFAFVTSNIEGKCAGGHIKSNGIDFYFAPENKPQEFYSNKALTLITEIDDPNITLSEHGTFLEVKTPLSIQEKYALKQEIAKRFSDTYDTSIMVLYDGQIIEINSEARNIKTIDGAQAFVGDNNKVFIKISNDGYQVLDQGKGFSDEKGTSAEQIMYEKFLPPGRSTKPFNRNNQENKAQLLVKEEQFRTVQNSSEQCSVSLMVSGITIESYNLSNRLSESFPAEHCVIAFNTVTLDESRTKILKDNSFLASLEKVVADIEAIEDPGERIKAYNLISGCLRAMAGDLSQTKNEDYRNFITVTNTILRPRVLETMKTLEESGVTFLPNDKEFKHISAPDVIFVDEALFNFDARSIGTREPLWLGRRIQSLYLVDMKYGDGEFHPLSFESQGILYLDKNTFEKLQKDPEGQAVLNHMVNHWDDYESPAKIEGKRTMPSGRFNFQKNETDNKTVEAKVTEQSNTSEFNWDQSFKDFIVKKEIMMLERGERTEENTTLKAYINTLLEKIDKPQSQRTEDEMNNKGFEQRHEEMERQRLMTQLLFGLPWDFGTQWGKDSAGRLLDGLISMQSHSGSIHIEDLNKVFLNHPTGQQMILKLIDSQKSDSEKDKGNPMYEIFLSKIKSFDTPFARELLEKAMKEPSFDFSILTAFMESGTFTLNSEWEQKVFQKSFEAHKKGLSSFVENIEQGVTNLKNPKKYSFYPDTEVIKELYSYIKFINVFFKSSPDFSNPQIAVWAEQMVKEYAQMVSMIEKHYTPENPYLSSNLGENVIIIGGNILKNLPLQTDEQRAWSENIQEDIQPVLFQESLLNNYSGTIVAVLGMYLGNTTLTSALKPSIMRTLSQIASIIEKYKFNISNSSYTNYPNFKYGADGLTIVVMEFLNNPACTKEFKSEINILSELVEKQFGRNSTSSLKSIEVLLECTSFGYIDTERIGRILHIIADQVLRNETKPLRFNDMNDDMISLLAKYCKNPNIVMQSYENINIVLEAFSKVLNIVPSAQYKETRNGNVTSNNNQEHYSISDFVLSFERFITNTSWQINIELEKKLVSIFEQLFVLSPVLNEPKVNGYLSHFEQSQNFLNKKIGSVFMSFFANEFFDFEDVITQRTLAQVMSVVFKLKLKQPEQVLEIYEKVFQNPKLLRIPLANLREEEKSKLQHLESFGMNNARDFFLPNGYYLPQLLSLPDIKDLYGTFSDGYRNIRGALGSNFDETKYYFQLSFAAKNYPELVNLAEQNQIFHVCFYLGLTDPDRIKDLKYFIETSTIIPKTIFDQINFLSVYLHILDRGAKDSAALAKNICTLMSKKELKDIYEQTTNEIINSPNSISPQTQKVIDFLQSDEIHLSEEAQELIVESYFSGIRVSEMIARRRKNIDPFDKYVAVIPDKEAVTKAVHSQNVSWDIFVRELIQNARDATIIVQENISDISLPISMKVVSETDKDGNKVTVFEIEDQGNGLDMDVIKNKLFQFNERDQQKVTNENIEGGIGWGFGSVALVAKIIDITGFKNGIKTHARIEVEREGELVTDLVFLGGSEETVDLSLHGSKIRIALSSDLPSAWQEKIISNAIERYGRSIVSQFPMVYLEQNLKPLKHKDQISITYVGIDERGNEKEGTLQVSFLNHQEYGWSEVRRRGLSLGSINSSNFDLLKYVHPSLRAILDSNGIDVQVELPTWMKPTRVRAGVAISNAQLEQLRKTVSITVLKEIAEQYRRGALHVPVLSNDSLYDKNYIDDERLFTDIKNVNDVLKGNIQKCLELSMEKFAGGSPYYIQHLLMNIVQKDGLTLNSIRKSILENPMNAEGMGVPQLPAAVIMQIKNTNQKIVNSETDTRLYERIKQMLEDIGVSAPVRLTSGDSQAGYPTGLEMRLSLAQDDPERFIFVVNEELTHYVEQLLLRAKGDQELLNFMMPFIQHVRPDLITDYINVDPKIIFEKMRNSTMMPKEVKYYMGSHTESEETPFGFIRKRLLEMLAIKMTSTLSS
ncbi:MAG: hypothetical protein WCJ19_01240 [bacterium]